MMGRTLDLQAVIDGQTRIRPHLPLLAVMTLIMFLDGYDVFMLGRIAPAMAQSFGEPVARLTMVFLVQQMGLAIGSLVIGPVSDRYGRKLLLMVSAAAFGAFTLGTVWTHSLVQVAILRGLAGVFLAGVIPNAAALLTEFAPPGRRASFVSIAFTGFTAGGAAGALVAIWLLKRYGWQSGFWLGGIVPLLSVFLLGFVVHESLQFRARRDPHDPAIGRSLKRIDPNLQLADVLAYRAGPDTQTARPAAGGVWNLLSDGRMPLTLLLWIAYFIALGIIALLASWMAAFFLDRSGIPLEVSAAYSLLSFAAGIGGTTTVGVLMDRFGRTRVLALLFVSDALAMMLMGSLHFGGWPFVAVTIVWGYCQAGGQGGINALCAQAYPTEIRSTGVGWAFGIGRAGGIVLPALGGLAFSNGMSLARSFLWLGFLPLIVVAALFGIGRLETKGKLGT
jgi:AAHS family 4-hydroxybenzoate transporter-like MFS transporter